MQKPSRRQFLAVAAVLLCCLPLLSASLAAQSDVGRNEPSVESYRSNSGAAPSNPCVGTMTQPATGTTVIAVQGYSWHDGDSGKKPGKLVGVGQKGSVEWVHHTADHGVGWQYDVDPMDNGNVFVTGTKNHATVVYEFNPRTQEHEWQETLPIKDTHDVDLINNGTQLLVANMRNYDEESDENRDSIFVYDLQKDKVVWRWYFTDHYDPEKMPKESDGKNFTNDWTHVNDVDKVGDGRYLASPRNFDEAIVVNRKTNEIEMKLGADNREETLDRQHNPDYLESKNNTPTLLVGDSDNDRIVEYERTGDGGWNRTWTLGTGDDLKWPRDADRLPNGNTLVGDSRNQRAVEVTPQGEVVWEFYAPYLVYDVARLKTDEHTGGPTMTDLNATGTYGLKGDTALHENWSNVQQCAAHLQSIDGWVAGQKPTTTEDGTTNGSGVNDNDDRNDGSLNGNGSDGPNGSDGGEGASGTVPGFGVAAAVAALLAAVAFVARRRSD